MIQTALRKVLFRAAPRCDLAVMRIAIVGFGVWTLATSEIELGLQSVSTRSNVPVVWIEPLLRLGVPSTVSFPLLRALVVACGLAALVGIRTPISLASFALGNLVLRAWLASVGRFDHIHTVTAIALLVLACSPAGAELSVDAWRRRGWTLDASRRSRSASWPTLVIGCVMTMAYLSAGTTKLVGGGFEWCNGSTLQFYAMFKGVPLEAPLGPWLSTQHVLARVLSWATLLFELSFGICLFVPRARWVYLTIGAAFHVLSHLSVAAPFYSFVVLYSCWIPWSALFARLFPAHRAR